ncbi:MAG: phage tail protein [Proteobacteria bacterium]|nr:phage tail protein [Pseudomonadota bacterium]
MSSARKDPYGSFGFKVVVKVDGADAPIGYFQEVSGLSVQINVQDVVEGGLNDTTRKLIGNASYTNITLKRGVCDKGMFAWIEKFLQGGKITRLDGSIELLDDSGATKLTYTFKKGIPVKWDGPSLSVMQDAIATETLEIAHEGLKIT